MQSPRSQSPNQSVTARPEACRDLQDLGFRLPSHDQSLGSKGFRVQGLNPKPQKEVLGRLEAREGGPGARVELSSALAVGAVFRSASFLFKVFVVSRGY